MLDDDDDEEDDDDDQEDDDEDEDRRHIENSFHLGYKYEDIVNLLEIYHGVSMTVCTLKRRLQKYNLKKNAENDEQELRSIIEKEIEGIGKLAGYRKIWHFLRIKHHVHAPRKVVAIIVQELDPEASKARKGTKLKRRKYTSYGPNHCWHIDGITGPRTCSGLCLSRNSGLPLPKYFLHMLGQSLGTKVMQ